MGERVGIIQIAKANLVDDNKIQLQTELRIDYFLQKVFLHALR